MAGMGLKMSLIGIWGCSEVWGFGYGVMGMEKSSNRLRSEWGVWV